MNYTNCSKTLDDKSQSEIYNKFEENKTLLSKPLPKGWDNIESVFQKTNNAFVSLAIRSNHK